MAKYAQFKVGDGYNGFDYVEFTPHETDTVRTNYQGSRCYYRSGAWHVARGCGAPREDKDGPYFGVPGVPEPVGPQTPATGQKFDDGKDEPGLLLSGCNLAVAGVIAVLSFGFRKYKKRNGWKDVPERTRRYKNALHRHLAAIERGEILDDGPGGSGKPHIDHVACNAMFLSQIHHEGGE